MLRSYKFMMEKVSNLEALNIEKTQVTFRCEKCPFVSSSEKGVKTHLTRKHTIISATGYPRKCELCNKQFNNPNDFKKHMKSHSYKEAKFKCEDCDFVGKCAETMDVHMGKTHTDSFEYGLCEISFENLENLALHLHTYRCKRCYLKQIKISDIKDHAIKKHH